MNAGPPSGGPPSTMVQTTKPTAPAVSSYTVLRPICVNGQRCEVGATVELTPAQYAEGAAAGKVGPLVESKPPAKPVEDTKPKEDSP